MPTFIYDIYVYQVIATLIATSNSCSITQDLNRLNQEHRHHSQEQAVFNAYQSIIEDQKANANKLLAETEEIYESKISAMRSEFEFKLKRIQAELESHLSGKSSEISEGSLTSECSSIYASQ